MIQMLITPEAFGADREAVRVALEAENIESRPVWKPMHLQPVFKIEGKSSKLKTQSLNEGNHYADTSSRKDWGFPLKDLRPHKTPRQVKPGSTPIIQNSGFRQQNYPARVVGGAVAEELFDRGLCLPSGT